MVSLLQRMLSVCSLPVAERRKRRRKRRRRPLPKLPPRVRAAMAETPAARRRRRRRPLNKLDTPGKLLCCQSPLRTLRALSNFATTLLLSLFERSAEPTTCLTVLGTVFLRNGQG